MFKRSQLPKPIILAELEAYFEKHARRIPNQRHFYRITKDLPAFKRVAERRDISSDTCVGRCVANLIIPKGAFVYVNWAVFMSGCSRPDDFKMRASKAYVHSIASLRGLPKTKAVSCGHTSRIPSLTYTPGATAVPNAPFSWNNEQCASGIHFFLNLKHAYEYGDL